MDTGKGLIIQAKVQNSKILLLRKFMHRVWQTVIWFSDRKRSKHSSGPQAKQVKDSSGSLAKRVKTHFGFSGKIGNYTAEVILENKAELVVKVKREVKPVIRNL